MLSPASQVGARRRVPVVWHCIAFVVPVRVMRSPVVRFASNR